MVDHQAAADWKRVLRRSFGVPDIVSDEHAMAAIHQWVFKALVSSKLVVADRAKAAADLANGVLRSGKQGDLDYFVIGELGPHLEHPFGYSAAEVVARQAFPTMTVFTSGTGEAILSVAKAVVDRVLGYVEAHRFTDGDGHTT